MTMRQSGFRLAAAALALGWIAIALPLPAALSSRNRSSIATPTPEAATATGTERRSSRRTSTPNPSDPFAQFRVPSRGTPAPAGSQPTAPNVTKKAPAKPSTTNVRRTLPPGQARPGATPAVPGAAGAPGAPGTTPDIVRSNSMFLDPGEGIFTVGKTFETAIVYESVKRSEADRMAAVVQYDPSLVMPVGVVKQNVEKYLADEQAFHANVHADEGIVTIEAQLKEAPPSGPLAWAKIRWQALSPSPRTQINLIQTRDLATGVFLKDHNLVGDPATRLSGLIGGEYEITAPDLSSGAEAALDDVNVGYRSRFSTEKSGQIGLRIVAPAAAIQVGDTFFADVMLDNPEAAQFDMLDLVITYDPVVLQVVDCDKGNWIQKGLNIFDGTYHKKFPFDVHLENAAYNSLGQIRYTMGITRPDYVFPSGKMASILFKAIAPDSSSAINFAVQEEEDKPTTRVELMGRAMVEEADLQGTSVKVIP